MWLIPALRFSASPKAMARRATLGSTRPIVSRPEAIRGEAQAEIEIDWPCIEVRIMILLIAKILI
jgi:hypothetical protein